MVSGRGLWILPSLLLLLGGVVAGNDNLLIISVDTLRADRLGTYGYRQNQTPHIDRWADEGVLFERAYAEVPLTLPSHSTLFTATLPFFHGVRDNAGFSLPEEAVTLAEILQPAGYETAAFISSYVLDSRFGLDQGFEHYDDEVGSERAALLSAASLRRDAATTTDRFLSWLETRGGRPFFAWLHFYDPHAPFAGSYDQQVSAVDRSIGRLDRFLREKGLLQSTHLFFLADHGESLGEHGESAHGFFVYDATLRIPFILRPAASFEVRKKRVVEPVSLVDVMPTALRLLDLRAPQSAQGRSLLTALSGGRTRPRPLYAESFLPRLQFGWGALESVRWGEHKLIDAPRPELYDLESDPGETRNLFSAQRALGNQLRETLRQIKSRFSSQSADSARNSVDPETAQRLAALGYVALAAPTTAVEGSSGVDPKDRIEAFEEYQAVLPMVKNRSSAQSALERISGLRSRFPDLRGLYELEALAHQSAGDLRRGVVAYRKALEENPDNHLARANLGQLQLQLQEFEAAEETFREVLSGNDTDYRSRNNLALLLRMRGQHSEALGQLQRVVETADDYATGWTNLGISLVLADRLEEAEAAFRKAIRLEPETAAGHLHLGRLLARLGRTEEARRELQRAAQLDPRSAPRRP